MTRILLIGYFCALSLSSSFSNSSPGRYAGMITSVFNVFIFVSCPGKATRYWIVFLLLVAYFDVLFILRRIFSVGIIVIIRIGIASGIVRICAVIVSGIIRICAVIVSGVIRIIICVCAVISIITL